MPVNDSSSLGLPANSSDTMTSATANVTTARIYPVEYYGPVLRVVGTLLVGVIFVVGLVGNALVVAVVTRTRRLRSPTTWYLVSLAVADIVTLVSAAPGKLAVFHMVVGEWVLGRVGCSAAAFLRYLGCNVSSLSIVAVTIER